MRPGLVVEHQIARQPLLRRADGVIGVQVDLLVFDAFPQPFYEYVVSPASFSVHADLNALVFQESRELLAGELAPLVSVEDLRAAILRDRLPHGVEAEVCSERIGEPPGQYPATRPVEHGEEIHKAPAHGKWSERPGVVALSPSLSSPNRTCTSQRIRLSIQALRNAKATSA